MPPSELWNLLHISASLRQTAPNIPPRHGLIMTCNSAHLPHLTPVFAGTNTIHVGGYSVCQHQSLRSHQGGLANTVVLPITILTTILFVLILCQHLLVDNRLIPEEYLLQVTHGRCRKMVDDVPSTIVFGYEAQSRSAKVW